MFHAKIKQDIAQVGHTIIGTTDGKRNFLYTVGLTEVGLPELLVFGMRHDHGAIILNDAARIMREKGAFNDGDMTDDLANLITGFKAFSAEQGRNYVVQAIHYYEGTAKTPRFLQLVIPDREGRMPGQSNYDEAYMGRYQPLLWEA